MRALFMCVIFWMVIVGHAGLLMAQDFSKLSEAERKQVNDWMAERAKTMIDAHKLEGEIDQAWADTKYSTPEVDALRKRYLELQQELLRTQEELRKKVREIPAVLEKRRQLDEAKKDIQKLSKKVSEATDRK